MALYNGDSPSIQGVAEAAISKGDYVKQGTIATNGQYVTPCTAGARGIGFAAEDIAAGATGRIIVAGTAQALAHDSGITGGSTILKAAASGRANGATTNKDVIIAHALSSSAAQDDLIDVLVVHYTLSV